MLRSTLAAIALVAFAMPGVPAAAQDAGFTPIGDFAEYRVDGLRDGVHEGAPVHFLDMTLRNRSTTTTFPATIQEVRWQGRSTGQEARPLHRDLTRFGMYDFIEPAETVSVTYVIPARADIEGVTVEYPKAGDGPRGRTWTWDELRSGDLAGEGEDSASSSTSYLGNG